MENREYTSITAHEFRTRLRQQDSLSFLKVSGTVSMSKSVFEHPVIIHDCIFDTLDFNQSTFNEKLQIRRCEIKSLILQKGHYLKELDLKKSTIQRLRLPHCTFEGDVILSETNLGSLTCFKSEFKANLKADRIKAFTSLVFDEVICHAHFSLRHCIISNEISAKKLKVLGETTLNNTDVQKDFDLSFSHLEGNVKANELKVGFSLKFYQASFNGLCEFERISIVQNLNLSGAQAGEQASFSFLNATISRLIIDHNLVDGRLHYEKSERYHLAAKEYGFLRNFFIESHNFEAEDWAYYHLKRTLRKSRPSEGMIQRINQLLEWIFLDIGCGYGIHPFRTLGVCFFMILSFAFCYGFLVPYDAQAQFFSFAPQLNPAIYAFDLSLTVFSGGYADFPAYGVAKFLAAIEYLFGLVFMGLFVVAISRKIIR